MKKLVANKKKRLNLAFIHKQINNNDVFIINWHMYTLQKKILTRANTNLKWKTFHSPKNPN